MLFRSGKFDKVLDLEECFLQAEPSDAIRLTVRKFAMENEYAFFDIRQQEGFLRNLIIRNSSFGELMVILVFFHEDREKREKILDFLHDSFPQITSLMYVINPKANDSIFDLDVEFYKGKDHIIEELDGLKFRISAKSFFQTNTAQARKLYDATKKYAALTGSETVYDLYTGTGTIANYLARDAKKVIGIDSIPEAIENAGENSELNSISNTRFFAGDIKDLLSEEFIDRHGKPEIMIIDPPRAGMHKNVVKSILYAAPQRMVYVSCNPATQARDIALLDEKYRVKAVQPVDMFPHTHHVENIVLLEKRD